jgi:hypothetical protein
LYFVLKFVKNCIFFFLWRLVDLKLANGLSKDHAVFIFIYPSLLLHWMWRREFLAYAGKSATIQYCTITKKIPILIFRVKKNLHPNMLGKVSQISSELFCGTHFTFRTKCCMYFTHKFTRCSYMLDWFFYDWGNT